MYRPWPRQRPRGANVRSPHPGACCATPTPDAKRPTPGPREDPYMLQDPICNIIEYEICIIRQVPDVTDARSCWIGENYPEWALDHLEGCQQCYRSVYFHQHGDHPPRFTFYKDGQVYAHPKDYLRNFWHILDLLDSYVELVDNCETMARWAVLPSQRGNLDYTRSNCINDLREGKLR